MIGNFALKLMLWFLKTLPSLDLPDISGYFNGFGQLVNIFAWSNQFLPIDFFIVVFACTAAFYSFRLLIAVFKFVRQFL